MSDTPIDKHGRPVMIGDLIRVFHFTARRRRKVYKHHVVVKADATGYIRADGKDWYAVDALDYFAKGMDIAHRCRMDKVGEFEIIDGPSVERPGGIEYWWKRPKQKKNGHDHNG